MKRRHEKPLPRTNPSGKRVYVARATDDDGRRHYLGTRELKREAQDLIDAFYDTDRTPATVTVGTYFKGWLDRHPRSERTDKGYDGKVRAVLDVKLDGRLLRDWPLGEVEVRQADDLVDYMLREQGRAVNGVRGVLRVLSAMWQDARRDGNRMPGNPWMGLRIRAADRRVTKPPRKTYTWTWEQMHEFAMACGRYEPMVRTVSDCGLRIGELFPLERGDVFDGECGDPDCWFTQKGIARPHLHVHRSAWRRRVQDGTKIDHGEAYAGRETPVAPGLAVMLDGMPKRIDTRLLFPTLDGEVWDRDFYRDVWEPARKATGMWTAKPHDFRHSYVSLMRAAGVDPADLAYWTGHTVATATARYTHSTGASVDVALGAVG